MKNKKSLGQHWLKNREILNEIAGLAGESGASVCLEIGPGLGTLTSSLFKFFDKVVAVEYDEDLARKLPGQFPGKNLEVINADILQFDFRGMPDDYAVAGNIPYYITSPIVEKVLTASKLPSRIVLLMQKEVAERMAGVDGRESRISLIIKNRAEVELGPVVMRNEFTPPPKVDSQVLVLTPFRDGAKYDEAMFKVIDRAFLAPRKKLVHNLAGLKSREELTRILVKLGINSDARPADLSLEDYYRLWCEIR